VVHVERGEERAAGPGPVSIGLRSQVLEPRVQPRLGHVLVGREPADTALRSEVWARVEVAAEREVDRGVERAGVERAQQAAPSGGARVAGQDVPSRRQPCTREHTIAQRSHQHLHLGAALDQRAHQRRQQHDVAQAVEQVHQQHALTSRILALQGGAAAGPLGLRVGRAHDVRQPHAPSVAELPGPVCA
jgi:hypothetical protein